MAKKQEPSRTPPETKGPVESGPSTDAAAGVGNSANVASAPIGSVPPDPKGDDAVAQRFVSILHAADEDDPEEPDEILFILQTMSPEARGRVIAAYEATSGDWYGDVQSTCDASLSAQILALDVGVADADAEVIVVADKPPEWTGRAVGQWIGQVYASDLVARDRLQHVFEDRAKAAAYGRTSRRASILVAEGDGFAVYAIEALDPLGFAFTLGNTTDPSGGWRGMSRVRGNDGVLAFFTEDGGQFVPQTKGGGAERHDVTYENVTAKADPDSVTALEEARSHEVEGEGDETTDDAREPFLAAFQDALRELALESLDASEREARSRGRAFKGGPAAVGPEEISAVRKCAADVAAVDDELRREHMRMHDSGPIPEILEPLERRRQTALSAYPMVARFEASDLVGLDDDSLIATLGAEVPGVLRDIDEARHLMEQGRIDLFGCDALVLATSSRFGIDDPERKEWLDGRVSAAKGLSTTTLLLAAAGIGLALITGGAALGVWAGVFAEGGAAVAIGGAAGLAAIPVNTALTIGQTDATAAKSVMGNTDVDPNESMVPGDLTADYAMLALAWAGMGLDMGVVVELLAPVQAGSRTLPAATRTVALKAGRAVEEAEALIPATLREHGVSEDLIESTAAARKGDASVGVGAAVEATEGRAGALAALDARNVKYIEIDGRSVFVDYKVAPSGRVTEISLRIGRDATPEMIALHQRVVAQLERYTGLSGMMRSLIDRMSIPVPGMAAYEGRVEVQKLSDAWALVAKSLVGKSYDDPAAAQLVADLDDLEMQIARHRERFDDWSIRGTGTIAAQFTRVPKALEPDDVLVDANSAIALGKRSEGVVGNTREELTADTLQGRPTAVTPRAADEWKTHTPVSVATSKTTGTPEQQAEILNALEAMRVGRAKGASDRQIVMEAFLAETTSGKPATFATADDKVINPLARSAIPEIPVDRMGGPVSVADWLRINRGTDRFVTEILGKYRLTVIPIQPTGAP